MSTKRISGKEERTFRLNEEEDNEAQFKDQPAAVKKIVPPINCSKRPRVNKLVKSDGCHHGQVLIHGWGLSASLK